MATHIVKFDVSGQTFSISRNSLELGPYSKLKQLVFTQMKHACHGAILVDRPADIFGAILAFYQTGSLHIPTNSCPLAFLTEMRYWDIGTEYLSECCYIRLQCFLEEQQAITKFRSHERKCDDVTQSRFSTFMCSRVMNVRVAIWKILDSRSTKFLSRVYFCLCLLMVTASLLTIACGTVRSFQRNMTNCEKVEYMIFSGMEDAQLVKDILPSDCTDEVIPNVTLIIPETTGDDYDTDYVYAELYDTDEYRQFNLTGPLPLQGGNGSVPKRVKIPNMLLKYYGLDMLDTVSSVFFTIDLLLRLFCCPCLRRYFSSLINLADTIALAATYIHIIALGHFKQIRFRHEWYGVIEYLQMFRSLRFFRIVTSLPAGRVLMYTVVANAKDLLVFIMFILSGMCVFASVLYLVEGSNNVNSIPTGWYWAVVTMTTVGYGDIKPVTAGGRLTACICGVSGLLLFAMTVPIFANHFLTLYTYISSENIVERMMVHDRTLPKIESYILTGDNERMAKEKPTKEKLALGALDVVTAVKIRDS